MRIYRLVPDEKGIVTWPQLNPARGSTVTIGTFDGMHKGHQALLHRVTSLAKSSRTRSVVILFDPRPAFVFSYRKSHQKTDPAPDVPDPLEIQPIEDRLSLLDALGIDDALVVRFTTAFSQNSYTSFLGQLISQRVANSHNPVHTLGLQNLVLGTDARLGRDGSGTAEKIERIAEAFRFFDLVIVDDAGPGFVHIPAGVVKGVPVEKKVRVWSSSNLRHLLEQGDIAGAREITGRNHCVEGTVVHGEGRGRKLGFPTANLGKTRGFVPGDGVYEGWFVDGKDRYPAAISIGSKPTFRSAGKHSLLEAYALADGEQPDFYGHRVRVEFVRKIGEQTKFAAVSNLVKAMGRWADEVKADLLEEKTAS